jgi:cyclopropane-fatty-acyl-phospholipid synthase
MDDHEQSVTGLRSIPRAVAPARNAQDLETGQGGFRPRLLRHLLLGLGDPPVQVTLWNGERLVPASGAAPVARVHIHDSRALWPLVLDPWLHFGDLYARGDVDVEGDLVQFLTCVYRASASARHRRGGMASLVDWWLHRPRSTSLGRARDNIHAHYDLGNDFYRLWLDREMVYTCAYFPHPEAGLEEAQLAKMHHVCRKLRLRPGDSVVEAGCGWGSLALFMARHYGVRVRAYNISREQIAWARARAKDEGLADRVEFVEDDYRNISGSYDAFVSVGMLEHVGIRYYPVLGGVIDRVLRDDGRGLIHTIGRARPGQMNAWIERRIFPGACPPSLDQMMDILEPYRFAVLDVENLRLHYARTLEHWLSRFDAATDEVRRMFDEKFVRSWRLYLCGSIASFLTGELQLFQVAFNRATSNEVPWTREYLYSTAVAGEATVSGQQIARPAANNGD